MEWKDGGSENFRWTADGNGAWGAVWAVGQRWIAWVSRKDGSREVTHHATEDDARKKCEMVMEGDLRDAVDNV